MHIIFGYQTGPSYGEIEEQDGGFSVDILSNGIIEYKTYIFDNKEKSRETYQVDDSSLQKIKDIVTFYNKKIDEIPNHLDNGSCDGDGNFFTFMDKKIIAWNIEYTDIEEIQKKNPSYYELYRENIQYENRILIIFVRIIKVLEAIGFKLTISSFSVIK
ncbi:hypothetical protein [Clostridium beijerinckii]|uniref:hypothetical protein n=1 Tax=Clostridium beijerinckii TaxID=1520 RepID=UPI000809B60C|nr:hypothetical protein [Clostridium beijerinckii]OCA97876.1 hypothetical protein BGS1_02295 [Clostridium beijerinckii]